MNKFAKFALRVLGIIGIGVGAACSYEGFKLINTLDDIDVEEAQEKARTKREEECIDLDPDDLDL
jgi:hypothetical protein